MGSHSPDHRWKGKRKTITRKKKDRGEGKNRCLTRPSVHAPEGEAHPPLSPSKYLGSGRPKMLNRNREKREWRNFLPFLFERGRFASTQKGIHIPKEMRPSLGRGTRKKKKEAGPHSRSSGDKKDNKEKSPSNIGPTKGGGEKLLFPSRKKKRRENPKKTFPMRRGKKGKSSSKKRKKGKKKRDLSPTASGIGGGGN